MHSHPHERPLTPLLVGGAFLLILALTALIAANDDTPRPRPSPPSAEPERIPLRIDEGDAFVVPPGKRLAIHGIVTRATWADAVPVVIRFDGDTVFQRSLFAGDVVTLPAGLAATAGTVVEIDRQAVAADSRVTLLTELVDAR